MASTFSGDETAPFFGFLGAAAALVFSCMGAAYGTAKSGVGVASMGVMRPELVMKSIVPVVMAGVLGIYGLIIAVIISTGINPKAKSYYLFDGYAHLSSGLACGLAGLSAGMAIGIVGDAGVRLWLSMDSLSVSSSLPGLVNPEQNRVQSSETWVIAGRLHLVVSTPILAASAV
ncbi:ATPase, F0/V0 complex, subunit C protein [Gossypium australe]|uniref:V-type proton ATPase proteolipid subunit n=1 Tax=Gossypium australe TaxID=47621 RepID=A0A5B6VXU3_9ROSI|nr:ATPase, F0/V0 complex, subunit C protein [Gossypium australe]